MRKIDVFNVFLLVENKYFFIRSLDKTGSHVAEWGVIFDNLFLPNYKVD